MDLAATDLAIVAAVFLLAGAVKGAIGVGLPTVGMGLLGAWLPVDQAAAILILPALLTNIWQMLNGGSFPALVRRLWPMMGCLMIGTLIAVGIITAANTSLAVSLLGVMLIAYAAMTLSGWRIPVPPRAEPVLSPVIGLATGLVTGSTGTFVIPAVPYLETLNLDKNQLVQSFAFTACVATLSLALGLGFNDSLGPGVLIPGTIALVAAFSGMAVGQSVRDRLSVDVFRRWVLIGLMALGGTMILRALL